tara:strand:+ start:1838 stop:4132 length:2295 start_codon:yes stop_codon:yes gene_type:complete
MEPSFSVHVIAIGDYDQNVSSPFDPLGDGGELVWNEVDRVGQLFEQLGGQVYVDRSTPAHLRGADWAKRQQTDWADSSPGMSSALVWIGHGVSDGSHAWLASYGSDTRNPNSGHNATELAVSIHTEWSNRQNYDRSWAMIVVEACGAERFLDLVNSDIARMYSVSPRRYVLVSAGGEGTTFLGNFSRALASVVESFTDNDDAIEVWDFARRLEDHLQVSGGAVSTRSLAGAAPILRTKLFENGITATQDVVLELQQFVSQLPEATRSHYIPKAQAGEQGEVAWHFMGRDRERRTVATWLSKNDHGMLVVTGAAGAGKSAFLGHLLAASNPRLQALLTEAGLGGALPPDEPFPAEVFDAALTLTGYSAADVVARISHELGIEQRAAVGLTAQVRQVVETLRRRETVVTLMLDSLDEAREALDIARYALAPLANSGQVRLIVGTRRSTAEALDVPGDHLPDILTALGDVAAVTVLSLEPDAEAVQGYVVSRLRRARSINLIASTTTDAVIGLVAEHVARRRQPFLFARLAIHEMLADPALLEPASGEPLDDLLNGGHRSLFARAVNRLQIRTPKALAVLEALAFAEGRGLPRADGLWAAVASALAGPSRVSDPDLAEVVSAAAPYVMVDGEAGQTVYRLAHQTFREYFRLGRSDDILRSERAVFEALVVATLGQVTPNPYIRDHLARHATNAGGWPDLDREARALDAMDVSSLASELAGNALPGDSARLGGDTAVTATHRDRRSSLQASDANVRRGEAPRSELASI